MTVDAHAHAGGKLTACGTRIATAAMVERLGRVLNVVS